MYPVTQSWSVTGNKTYPGPSTGAAVGRKSFATGWVPLGSSISPCPASWQAIDLGQAGTNLVNGWTHGAANNGLALGASSTDNYAWKKFTSENNPTGDPFLAVTYTTDGADYEFASKTPVTQVTPTQNGKIALSVTNEGATSWTPSNGYELSYRAYNSKGQQVANAPVFTPMPSTVQPGQSVIVNATVDALPAGSYAVDFDMYSGVGSGGGPVSFSSEGIPPFAMGLYVPVPPPVVNGVYPPTGYLSPTKTPELSTTSTGATSYQFTMTCQPLPGTTCPGGSISSGQITKPYWTPPPLIWNEPYTWTVTVTNSGGNTTAGPVSLIPEVPQPTVTSRLGGGSGQAFDPQTGDYTTSATDAAVAAPGPPLQILRTYNSLDPRTSGAFGTGWSSVLDTQIVPDTTASTSSVVVTMPDGSQARFGYATTNSDGSISYLPPFGSSDVLKKNGDGTWSLMAPGGVTYAFATGGTVAKITTPGGLAQSFTAASGQITTITDAASGRALHLTWSTPPGASYAHVASVTTDPPQSGQSGLTWLYSYTGDKLTQVCNPAQNCTGYTYGTSQSHFATAVMDAGPRSYYRLGDAAGSSSATDSVPVDLGTSAGTYNNVTLGGSGPLAGSPATSASFNGSSSYVALASNLVTDSTYLTVGLWFKVAAGNSGVLFGYQSNAITSSITGHWSRRCTSVPTGSCAGSSGTARWTRSPARPASRTGGGTTRC